MFNYQPNIWTLSLIRISNLTNPKPDLSPPLLSTPIPIQISLSKWQYLSLPSERSGHHLPPNPLTQHLYWKLTNSGQFYLQSVCLNLPDHSLKSHHYHLLIRPPLVCPNFHFWEGVLLLSQSSSFLFFSLKPDWAYKNISLITSAVST